MASARSTAQIVETTRQGAGILGLHTPAAASVVSRTGSSSPRRGDEDPLSASVTRRQWGPD